MTVPPPPVLPADMPYGFAPPPVARNGGILRPEWMGHVAIGYAFISPTVTVLWMLAIISVSDPRWAGSGSYASVPLQIYVLTPLPVLFGLYLGVRAAAGGIRLRSAGIVIEGILSVLLCPPLSLVAPIYIINMGLWG